MHKRILQFGLLSLIASLLSGCGITMPDSSSDGAAYILNEIFGFSPSQALSWTGTTTVIDDMFKYLNTGILSGAFLVFAYIFVVGTIYSAQDGTFLGKKWNKTFVPLRAIFGVVAIFPMKSGFCIAQYVIYLMAFVGTWLANSVWNGVAGSINNGASQVVIPGELSSQIKQSSIQLAFNEAMFQLDGLSSAPSKAPTVTIPINVTHVNDNTFKLYLTSFKDFLSPTTILNSSANLIPQDSLQKLAMDPSTGLIAGKILANYAATPKQGNTADTVYPGTFSGIFTGSDSRLYFVASDLSVTNGTLNVTASLASVTNPSDSVVQYALNLLQPIAATLTSTCGDGTFNCQTGLQTNIQNDLSDIINQVQSAEPGTVPSTSPVYDPDTFPGSSAPLGKGWWGAGDNYLSLDDAFATKLAQFFAAASNFSQDSTNYTITGTANFDTSLNEDILMLSNFKQFSTCKEPGYGCVVSAGSVSKKYTGVSAPISAGSTTDTNSIIYDLWRTSWTPGDPSRYLLCTMGGDQSECDIMAKEVPADSPKPAPLAGDSFSQNLLAQIDFHFMLRQTYANSGQPCPGDTSGKICTELDPQDVSKVANALLFAETAAKNANAIPSGSGGGNLNPFIISGQNSGLKYALGFLFSGLMGGSDGQAGTSQTIGLLQEVWCIGADDQDTFCQAINGTDPASTGLVANHFNMIRSAQLTGINLISGVVSSMMLIFYNFNSKISVIVNNLNKNIASALSDVELGAALGPFGSITSATGNAEITEATTAAYVSIAELSVNLMWLPVLLVIFTVLFMTGITFMILIPLMPFILFWSGKITWLLLVIEGLVAGPVCALAIA
ncbi:MAG: hypothetical protein EBX40_03625, partial [Gammaproteobacteria bacterium]|nr:hypothetical protein [Gammaproteobacteria bacterium]